VYRGSGVTAIEAAAAAIDAGQLVVVPSLRWYMLCGRADSATVARRMFAAKRRPPDRSLMLGIGHAEQARRMFEVHAATAALMNAFWPGDLALLLPWRAAAQGQRYAAIGGRAALVVQPVCVLGELCRRSRCDVAMTSANISPGGGSHGTPPALTPAEVFVFIAQAGADIAVLVDGGVCPYARDTTIVDGTGPTPRLARDGLVSRRAIVAALDAAGHSFIDDPAVPPSSSH